jgi:tetratricopeptide (TPR) repeat protein
MILYRPVGLQELELIYDSGMKAFPARLPQQPIFYPVLDLEYARQTASGWNAKSGQSAGYVTEFRVDDAYIGQFEQHTVGGSQHQEFWIPAEEMEKFNQHIMGHIKVLEAYFGEEFQGLIPETFALQGKNAVAQFTLLANSFLYQRMDFYLEIKRNHKAIFLNYPFWQTYEFKNPGLKKKVLQAIRESWFTSFPQIPLVSPVPEGGTPIKDTESRSFVDDADEETAPENQTDSYSPANRLDEETAPVTPTDSESFVDDLDEDVSPVKRTDSHAWVTPPEEEIGPPKRTNSPTPRHAIREDTSPGKPKDSQSLTPPVQKEITPVRKIASHFSQGVELGLSGKIREAIDELSRAVAADPGHVVAQTSLGVAFHRVGEDDRALSCYDAALKIDPRFAEAHYFRANILHGRGEVREAIAGYTIALGLKPDLVEAHQRPSPQDRLTDHNPAPAEMYRIAKPAHRILELNQTLETNSRQANLFKERAAEYYRLWNYEQVIADYSSSLAIQPDDASALYSRGLAYEQLGQIDRALEDFQRAIAINPQLSDVYINRGVEFGKMGNFRQSIASLTEGLRLAPDDPDGYFNRGTSYFQLGDFESAIQDFSNVIRLSPNDEAAYYWRGISNEAAARRDEAIADYKQFLVLSQDRDARQEIEQRLSQWDTGRRDRATHPGAISNERLQKDQVSAQEPDRAPDLYDLILALGERALHSTWFGSGLQGEGEKAEELYALTEQDQPVQGRELFDITSGIRRTVQGDFYALDPGATSHWLFIHAWDGNGFYIETDDPKIKRQLKTHFQAMEEVEGAPPPYEGLFLHI